MSARVFDDRPCDLGEGPLWHPLRETLYWFDITGRRMLAREAGGRSHHQSPAKLIHSGQQDQQIRRACQECRVRRHDHPLCVMCP